MKGTGMTGQELRTCVSAGTRFAAAHRKVWSRDWFGNSLALKGRTWTKQLAFEHAVEQKWQPGINLLGDVLE